MNIIDFPSRPRLPRALVKDGWWLVPTTSAKIIRFPVPDGRENVVPLRKTLRDLAREMAARDRLG